MKRSLFTIVLAVGCLAPTSCVPPTTQERGGGSATSKQAEAKPPELTFKTVLFATLMNKRDFEGKRYVPYELREGWNHSTLYEASDGVKLSLLTARFRTPARTRRELRRIVAEAEKVVEHRKNPKRTEERAVIYLKTEDPRYNVAIVWTKGRELHMLESSSLEHVLLLESKIRPQVAPNPES